MTLFIAPIVEGETEVACVTGLLQRTWLELLEATETLHVLQPARKPRNKLIDPQGINLATAVDDVFITMMRRVNRDSTGRGMVLLLLDAERDCPRDLAPRLLSVATNARSDADIACVLATWSLENWIVAGASTLAGVGDLPDLIPARDQFENRSGVAWLEKQMRSKNPARSYKKTVDAREFVKHMNLAECRVNSPSFDKLCRELEKRLPPAPDASAETTTA